jgi:hypothetical protein
MTIHMCELSRVAYLCPPSFYAFQNEDDGSKSPVLGIYGK